MKIAIIGGGAAGMFLANYLSHLKLNIDITIFERNFSLGRKVLASGNGKCNFSNFKALPSDYNNPLFMEEVFKKCPKEDLINYFSSLGLMFYFDNEGRMYPLSNSSKTIVDLLVYEFDCVKLVEKYAVDKIEIKNNKYYIGGTCFDILVLATGSNASIDETKVSSTYSYLDSLKLKMVETKPSLVGYKSNLKYIKLLKGLRMKAIVNMYRNKKCIFKEFGEVIFKEDGISGIVVMNSSHYYQKGDEIILDLLPDVEISELKYKINLRKKECTNSNYFLASILHPTLIKYLEKIGITDTDQIIDLLKNFNAKVYDTYSMHEAQVSKGGIDLSEINEDFELKKYPNCYALGEMLDINGLCGGYNLMFAFTSALIAGRKIEKLYEDKNN